MLTKLYLLFEQVESIGEICPKCDVVLTMYFVIFSFDSQFVCSSYLSGIYGYKC